VTDERGGRRIDLDAQTGLVVADETTQSHATTVTAHGAETLYQESDKKRRPDARYPVQAEPLANGAHTLAGPGPLGRIEVYSAADNRTSPVTGVRVDGGEYRFDFEPTEGPPDLSRLASRFSRPASRSSPPPQARRSSPGRSSRSTSARS
jgi:hypothetical protein